VTECIIVARDEKSVAVGAICCPHDRVLHVNYASFLEQLRELSKQSALLGRFQAPHRREEYDDISVAVIVHIKRFDPTFQASTTH
jgi:hypothetical protein